MPVGHLSGLVRTKDQNAMSSLKVFYRNSRVPPATMLTREEGRGLGNRNAWGLALRLEGLKDFSETSPEVMKPATRKVQFVDQNGQFQCLRWVLRYPGRCLSRNFNGGWGRRMAC
jgi:hypothetical protein